MNYKICVYAICKNESKFVEKWVNNMSGADYICVLDTGSTDDTFEKFRMYQEHDPNKFIVRQEVITPWRFDVARNKSMELIPEDADILVCTDLDELFNEDWATILRDNWDHTKYNRAYYDYAWSHTKTGEPTDIFTYDKIHTRDFIWKFPVHEVLVEKDATIQSKAISFGQVIFLQHFQDKEKSRSSYFDLLNLSVQENPEDCHVRMLLAREHLIKNEFEQAKKVYLDVLQMPMVDTADMKPVLIESLGRLAQIYQLQENYDEAIWYCHEMIREDHRYREPYIMLAEMFNTMKMYYLAEAIENEARLRCERLHTWIERADTWISALDRVEAVTRYGLGDLDKAIELTKICLEHYPDDVNLLKNYKILLTDKLESVEKKLSGEKDDE